MSFQFSPETIKEELEKQIKSLESTVKNSQKSIDDLSNQMRINPQRGNTSRSGDPRAKTLNSMKQSLGEKNNTLSGLKNQLSLISREIDVRNRKSQESEEIKEKSQNSVNLSILNNLKNISNESIAQSMQNKDFRNKIIIGGAALGGLALFSGIIFKKKRSTK